MDLILSPCYIKTYKEIAHRLSLLKVEWMQWGIDVTMNDLYGTIAQFELSLKSNKFMEISLHFLQA